MNFLVESFFISDFKLTEFSPEIIISTGNFFNFDKFTLLIFFETAIIVGILSLVLIILEFFDIVPLESKIILTGFFPLYDVLLVMDHHVTKYFFQ